jgi:hypothetical protein
MGALICKECGKRTDDITSRCQWCGARWCSRVWDWLFALAVMVFLPVGLIGCYVILPLVFLRRIHEKLGW